MWDSGRTLVTWLGWRMIEGWKEQGRREVTENCYDVPFVLLLLCIMKTFVMKAQSILLWGQVSAASMTARWSSRVGSTEHPEFRSCSSENSERHGSLTGP